MTNERPILFNAAMVQALLAGRKTQTRRIIKPQPESDWVTWCIQNNGGSNQYFTPTGMHLNTDRDYPQRENGECPYGQPGDFLWVKETWMLWGPPERQYVDYRATCPDADQIGPWKPSIFMPRAYSRITLEITDVRVERVQDISEADAQAEGVEPNWSGDLKGFDPELHGYLGVSRGDGEDEEGYYRSVRDAFAELWDSINGKRGYGWEINPFVWVIIFQVVAR